MGRRRLRIEDAGVAWRLPHSKSIWTRNEKKNKCYKYSNISSSSSSWTRGNVALLPAGEWLQAKGKKKNNKSNIQSINIVDPLLRFFASRTDAKLFVFCLFLYIFWLNETLFYITDVVSATTRHLLPLSLLPLFILLPLFFCSSFFFHFIYICSSPDSPGQHRVPLPRSIKRQSEPRWVKI